MAVATVGWFIAFRLKVDGPFDEVIRVFLILGGPGWLTWGALERMHFRRRPLHDTSAVESPVEVASTAGALGPSTEGKTKGHGHADARARKFLAESVDRASLHIDGRYTLPRSWGVYELPEGAAGKRFRTGNHPVRLEELTREHGTGVNVYALFTDPGLATGLAEVLNAPAQ
jgi:hypothetical protein